MSYSDDVTGLCEQLRAAVSGRNWSAIEAIDTLINRKVAGIEESVRQGRLTLEEATSLITLVQKNYSDLQSELEALRADCAQQIKSLNNQRKAINEYTKGG